MEVDTLGQKPAPVVKREETRSTTSSSTSDENHPVKEPEVGPSAVAPTKEKKRVRTYVDEDSGNVAFVAVDEESEGSVREISFEEVKEIAGRANQMVGFLIDELVA